MTTRMRTWTLVYDGECRFCLQCVRLLTRWDRRRCLNVVPFQDAAALAGLPAIPREQLEAAMQLVGPDGSVTAGAAAAPLLLGLLPGGSVTAMLFHVPGVPVLAAAVYRWVARRRHRLGCGSTACRRGGLERGFEGRRPPG